MGEGMKCEFCQGSGKDERFDPAPPCAECNGTGIADCCNGMTADTVRDHVQEKRLIKMMTDIYEASGVCRRNDWERHSQDKDISIYLSKQDAELLRKAADIKGQSVQDFVFLAAWDAAGLILRENDDE
jgi:hypothetical protein